MRQKVLKVQWLNITINRTLGLQVCRVCECGSLNTILPESKGQNNLNVYLTTVHRALQIVNGKLCFLFTSKSIRSCVGMNWWMDSVITCRDLPVTWHRHCYTCRDFPVTWHSSVIACHPRETWRYIRARPTSHNACSFFRAWVICNFVPPPVVTPKSQLPQNRNKFRIHMTAIPAFTPQTTGGAQHVSCFWSVFS